MRFRLVVALLLATSGRPALARLERAAILGISSSSTAAQVDRVLPGLTGEKVGLRSGDVVTGINGVPVRTMAEVGRAMRRIRAGETIRIAVRRGGGAVLLRGRAAPRPMEVFRNGTVTLGAVPFAGGELRDFLALPNRAQRGAPVAMILQGYTCNSVETSGEDDPLRLFIDQLLGRGIAVYRVEKPGVGESRGGVHCQDSDFETELAAFHAAYLALTTARGVDPSSVVLVGLSMGGVEAPLLANRLQQPPLGIVVWGTVVRPWYDYMLEVVRLQGFIGAGADPAEGEGRAASLRKPLSGIFLDGLSPKTVAAASEADASLLSRSLSWDGERRLFGRDYTYWQGVSRQRLAAAWRDVQSPVLALCGESDTAAIDCRDHRLIADIVNHKRPGFGQFSTIVGTGHGMTLEGSLEALRRGAGATDASYNPEVGVAIADWIQAQSPTNLPAGRNGAGPG